MSPSSGFASKNINVLNNSLILTGIGGFDTLTHHYIPYIGMFEPELHKSVCQFLL